MLADAAHYQHRDLPGHPQACLAPAQFWVAEIPFDAAAATGGEPIVVFANEGRWVAQCSDCNGAQLASRTDPRFMCVECANVLNHGAFRPLLWPRNVAAIEKLLEQRPLRRNRNWRPGETVKDLKAENAVFIPKHLVQAR